MGLKKKEEASQVGMGNDNQSSPRLVPVETISQILATPSLWDTSALTEDESYSLHLERERIISDGEAEEEKFIKCPVKLTAMAVIGHFKGPITAFTIEGCDLIFILMSFGNEAYDSSIGVLNRALGCRKVRILLINGLDSQYEWVKSVDWATS